jgi:uncharacterized membrane protein SpoIIM required for sporulation
MKSDQCVLFAAWKKLVMAYVLSMAIAFVAGTLLMKVGNIQPEQLFEAATKRLSYAVPIFDLGVQTGIDLGILLFAWNLGGALMTLALLYTAALFDPKRIGLPPRLVRAIFCGRRRMKLLCHLPGCAKIEAEPLRRLFVWLMIPLLGIILLGIESGLQISTTACLFGSLSAAILTLLPHGLIEIPTFALAGAVTYSAHLLIKVQARNRRPGFVFRHIERYRDGVPLAKIVLLVITGLLVAGWIEAHVTPQLI